MRGAPKVVHSWHPLISSVIKKSKEKSVGICFIITFKQIELENPAKYQIKGLSYGHILFDDTGLVTAIAVSVVRKTVDPPNDFA